VSQGASKGLTLGLTTLTMVAFAANSVLCRGALAVESMGAASFTALRVSSGALVLSLVVALGAREESESKASWRGAIALLVYALAFSVAYRSLPAGAGALVLFAAVQLTMWGASIYEGERPSPRAWVGGLLAFGGLVALLWPGRQAPDLGGALLMSVAGIAWGAYSLLGRGGANPLSTTRGNFLRAAPVALVFWGASLGFEAGESPATWTARGVALALASGALASGLGYALWYRVLEELETLTAAVAQLSVPVIAALGGVLLLDESLTPRMIMASLVTLAGIGLVSTAPKGAG
jgi:drug/metabolite transporter (DMT)-like permease